MVCGKANISRYTERCAILDRMIEWFKDEDQTIPVFMESFSINKSYCEQNFEQIIFYDKF